ncbi:MAG: hemerythrin domain-containing protein [Pseudomonadota bacterium]
MHAEFEQLLAHALATEDAAMPDALQALGRHLQAHFAEEEGWMEQSGFPARDCHRDEHAAVLHSLTEVIAAVSLHRFETGRAFLRELDAWFPAHADYLDSALAAWMCKHRYGGRPVVLHGRQHRSLTP